MDNYDRQRKRVDGHLEKTDEHICRFKEILQRWKQHSQQSDKVSDKCEKQMRRIDDILAGVGKRHCLRQSEGCNA